MEQPGGGQTSGNKTVISSDGGGAHVLVVDDDRRLRELLRRYLSDNGFLVTVAADAAEARATLRSLSFDLLVVDVMMPGENGLMLTADLRQTQDVPILLLTAMSETDDRIRGLESGADDYLTKPFEPRELLLRITGILRRVSSSPPVEDGGTLRLGDCQFDLRRRELTREGHRVRLTSAEVSLLTVLAEAANTPVSREDLTERSHISGSGRSVDVQVTRLRRKIEPDPKEPRYLQTVRGAGYVLRPDDP